MSPRRTLPQQLLHINLYLVLRRPLLLVIAAVCVTVLAAHYARQIEFQASFAALLPQDSETVQVLREVVDKIGGIGYVTLLVYSPNLDKVQDFVKAVVPALEQLPGVRYVNYRVETEFYEAYYPLFMELADLRDILKRLQDKRDVEKLKANPLYFSVDEEEDNKKSALRFDDIIEKYKTKDQALRFAHDGWYVNQDKNITLVLVKPNSIASDIDHSRRLVQAIQKTVAQVNPQRFDPQMRVAYTDRYVLRPLEQDAIDADLKKTAIVALLGVVLLITVYTRKLRAIVVIGLPLIMGVIWTFGFASLTLGHVNLITGFLLAVLMGLGIDYGIQIFCRFLEDRRLGLTVEKAVVNIYQRTARASLTAAVTSSVAFYTLMLTEFKGLSEFGFIAGTGLLLCLLAMVYVLPALLVLAERWAPIPAEPAVQQQERVVQARKFPLPLWIIGAFAAVIVLILLSYQKLEMEYDFRKLQVRGLPELQLQTMVNRIMGISLTPNAIVAQDYQEAQEITDIIARIQTDIRQQGGIPAIDKALSISSLLPRQQEEKIHLLRDIQAVLDDKIFAQVKPQDNQDIRKFQEHLEQEGLRKEDLPPSLTRMFTSVDASGNYMVWVFPRISLSNGREVKSFVSEMRRINDYRKDNPVKLSGEAFVFSDILVLVEKDIKIALLSTLTAVFFILLIDLRDVRRVLIVMTPLLAGLIVTLGIMIVTGFKVNFINIVVFPALIGLGIDSGVYLYHRYIENGSQQVMRVMWSTGAAVGLTVLTSLIGFGSLILARHGALNSFGWLAVMGMSAGLLASLVLFPAILQALEDRR